MSTEDRWTPDGLRFRQMLNDLAKTEVRIGFQAGENYSEDNVDVTDIAAWNELGTSNAPSRPFMRKSVDENAEKINAFIDQIGKEISRGTSSAETIQKKIGVFQKGLIQDKIVSGSYVPNAPSTIARKGSSKPLIDTGLMRRSVNYVVKTKGS